MKMAKATKADLDMAMELTQALDSLTCRWGPSMPEKIAKPEDGHESEWFNDDDHEHCQRALLYLLELARGASLLRVVWGCAVMLDPANKCVDPDADTIEHHPNIKALLLAKVARPASEYHEDMGDVLWWKFPVEEPPYCGSPLDVNWPGYHTHFTPLVVPDVPALPTVAEVSP